MRFFATDFGAVDTNGTARKQVYIYIYWAGMTCHYTTHRAGRDDVTTAKLVASRGECLGLYRCVLIIFKRE